MGRIKTDETLGERIREHLIDLGLESASARDSKSWGTAHRAMERGTHNFLAALNQLPDPSRDGTPDRVADMFVEDLCWGLDYSKFPKCTATPNDMRYDEMVAVEKIETISLCEHHFQTIYGHTHVAYIPGAQVLGLSKFARVTEFFARRPQIQERMTAQISAALKFILETQDVAIVQKCQHFCMVARGARQSNALTTTSQMSGKFRSEPALRKEFFDAIK